MNEAIVPQLVEATKRKLGILDMKHLTGLVYKDLRQYRLDAGKRRMLRNHKNRMQKFRIKSPRFWEGKVVDTRTDAARSRLYFELTNGQIVRADRVCGTRATGALYNNSKRRRALKNTGNPVLIKLVRAELHVNVMREGGIKTVAA